MKQGTKKLRLISILSVAILLVSLMGFAVIPTINDGKVFAQDCAVPEGLTLTYISDAEIGITWTKGADAEYTMIRAKYGSVPEDRNDGYLVYYGDLEYCSDTGVIIEETITPIYYRAWSENINNVWEETGISDFFEGGGMTLVGILMFCGIMSFLSLRSAFFGLKLMAGMSWFAFFVYFQSYPPAILAEGGPAHTAILVVSIGFGVMIVLAGLGRGIEQTKDRTGAFSIKTEGFGFRLPGWFNGAGAIGETDNNRRQRISNDTEAYRAKMHNALNPPRNKK